MDSGASASSPSTPQYATSRPSSPPPQREHQALGQQLPDQPAASRAERAAHRELAAPRRAARQQQAGDIGARDEQHEADGAEQHEQRRADVADERLLVGHATVSPRWCRGTAARGDRRSPCRSSFACAAVTPGRSRAIAWKYCTSRDAARIALDRQRGRRDLARREHPQVGLRRMDEDRGHDADDGRRHAVQADRAADDVRRRHRDACARRLRRSRRCAARTARRRVRCTPGRAGRACRRRRRSRRSFPAPSGGPAHPRRSDRRCPGDTPASAAKLRLSRL